MRIRHIHFAWAIPVALWLLVGACKKDEEEPENPYSKIVYDQPETPNDTLNAVSLTGIHRDILFPKCAVPGCHDGVFEPDFRTVQNSFSTLVYAPIKKNNAANSFTYRVVPGDTAASVLYERITNCCFVNDDDRMPQDNIGTGLPASDIQRIGTWIMNGAPNPNGNQAVRPDLEPVFPYYVAVNTSFNVDYSSINNREDTLIYNPFHIPAGTASFYFVALVNDDITPLAQMQVNTLKISTQMDDFSNALPFTGTFVNIPGQQPVWLISVPTAALTAGTTYYMRYYVNDGHHTNNTEFPVNSSNDLYKSYWSFILDL